MVGQPEPDAVDDEAAVTEILRRHPPFDGLPAGVRRANVARRAVDRYQQGDEILDAFTHPSVEVFVVIAGQVDLYNAARPVGAGPDERIGPGGIFGFSAMLINRSVGPRAVAAEAVTVAAIPASVVEPAFTSRPGARFLAEQGAASRQRVALAPYILVDDLIVTDPLVVDIADHVSDVARRMTERGSPCAAVRLDGGRYGLVTDATFAGTSWRTGCPGAHRSGRCSMPRCRRPSWVTPLPKP